jgi:hypothetical protein
MIRHLVAGLVAAVQLVLLGVRHFGRAEPLGDLGFQLRGALLHALQAFNVKVLSHPRITLRGELG